MKSFAEDPPRPSPGAHAKKSEFKRELPFDYGQNTGKTGIDYSQNHMQEIPASIESVATLSQGTPLRPREPIHSDFVHFGMCQNQRAAKFGIYQNRVKS